MTPRKGSAKAGPSNTYLRLLEGKIGSSDYSNAVKRNVGMAPPKSKKAAAN